MTKRARRILITTLVLVIAGAVLAAVFTAPQRQSGGSRATPQQTSAPTTSPSAPAEQPPSTTDTLASAAADQESAPGQPQPTNDAATAAPAQSLNGLRASGTGNDVSPRDQSPASLGSLDPRIGTIQVEFARGGARIARIAFADIWQTAEARRKAERYRQQLQSDATFDFTQVDESQRYVLSNLAPAFSVFINDQEVDLRAETAWSETAAGRFESRIVDSKDSPILHITREFVLGANYDITIRQRLRNLSNQSLNVQWTQLGPTDLAADLAGYIDRRRFDIGYIPDPVRQPDVVLAGDFEFERTALIKRFNNAMETTDSVERTELLTLWPNAAAGSRGYQLAWFGSMNRYFSVAVHSTSDDLATRGRSLDPSVQSIKLEVYGPGSTTPVVLTRLYSPVLTLEPQSAEAAVDLGLYAGPLDRHVLANPPMGLIAMREMILYSMGGCCTFLSFQWLAKLLLAFLSFLHDYALFDWGMAIIGLVIVVRTLLHPLTKKSQINMMRFGKQMGAMKPELDKLQKKYGSDPKRMQVEQMKLMREHGLNPFQLLGCLPMFLQMPIWIALWAMLYLAFDIRHQPAFYGIFQLFGDWNFLGDLSSPDHFWMLPGGGFRIPFVAHIDALNLLPLLLGVVFFIQQKYLSPPATPNMTAEQKQQQKIMKVMIVVLFPLFLYKAPSGLTLYIFTSTCIGIMESKYIRSHIDQLDLKKPGDNGTPALRDAPPKKPKDTLGRMWAEKLEAARAKRQAEQTKSFKKRK